jgi:hypothetical protein
MSKFTKKELSRPLEKMNQAQLEREIARYFNAGSDDAERDAGIARQVARSTAKFEKKQDKSNA